MAQVELRTFPNATVLAEAAGRLFVERLPQNRESFIALSGGRIAKSFYDAIVAEIRRTGRSIHGAHFFFADERCVPPTSEESNVLTARQALFDPLMVRADRIHRIHGEADPAYAAKEAEAELCRLAPMDADGLPILDLVILGMGEDGHTASLFPGEPLEARQNPAVFRPVVATKPPPNRVTISYGALRVAREVWVLASGAGKQEALSKIFANREDLPLGEVFRSRPMSLIFSDIAGFGADGVKYF